MQNFLRSLVLALFFLIPHHPLEAYPLSQQSQKFVRITAAIGCFMGAFIGGTVAAERYEKDILNVPHASAWQKIKTFPWLAVFVPAVVGATIGGLIGTCFTPESYLTSAENELHILENDAIFKDAIAENIPTSCLKKWFFFSKYPTVSVAEKLSDFSRSLKTAHGYCMTVVKSGIEPLQEIAQASLARIILLQQSILQRLDNIQNSSAYWAEYATKEEIKHLQEIAYHQRRLADVAWHQAYFPKPLTPVVISASMKIQG